jgi:threonine/homoserine/homoserine lactone efflux protein
MKRTAGLYIAWLVAAVMLVLAVAGRHPYSFYTFLRWICCTVFVYSAFTARCPLHRKRESQHRVNS